MFFREVHWTERNDEMNDEEELRAEFDAADLSGEIEQADELEGPLVAPYVTTSIRLPMPVMRAVRRAAARRGMKPTVLLREWVESALADEVAEEEATIPITVLRSAIAEYLAHRSA